MATVHYKLTIFIAGMMPTAQRAIQNLREICGDMADNQAFDLEVVDILEDPEAAEENGILATPTIIRKLPPPVRRIVGELADREQAMLALQFPEGTGFGGQVIDS